MSGTRVISTESRRELSSSFFSSLQRKAPKEIHAILTETLACFLPGRAKDLSAPMYKKNCSELTLLVQSVKLNLPKISKISPTFDKKTGFAPRLWGIIFTLNDQPRGLVVRVSDY